MVRGKLFRGPTNGSGSLRLESGRQRGDHVPLRFYGRFYEFQFYLSTSYLRLGADRCMWVDGMINKTTPTSYEDRPGVRSTTVRSGWPTSFFPDN